MTDDGEVLLGTDLATARVAEELHRASASGPSPLRDIAYRGAEHDLWRWVESPRDAVLAAFVGEYAGVADPAATRAALTMDDFHTLMTFARRSALAALRTRDAGTVRAAFGALSAIDLERVDWRDVVTAAALVSYAARRLELDPETVLAGAEERADPQVAEILGSATQDDVELVDWGYREVPSATGPVLCQDDGETVADELVAPAFAVAGALAADGRYRVGDITVGAELPTVWLADGNGVDAAHGRLRGCVSVHADPVDDASAHFLIVFLTAAGTAADAAAIAAAADGVPGRAALLGVAVGPRCAVVVAASSAAGAPPAEDAGSLARLRPPIEAALRAVPGE
jgi:hypothetical protein